MNPRFSQYAHIRPVNSSNAKPILSTSIPEIVQRGMKARPLQEFVLEQIRAAGGGAYVCTSVEEVRARIQGTLLLRGRGAFLAIELKRPKASRSTSAPILESNIQARALRMIKSEFPKTWVYKTNDRFTSGIPDLILCVG